jgi:hypothetical protein
MTIHIPGPLAAVLKVLAVFGLAWVIYQEGPPMYRYLFKFEAM